MLRSIIVSVSLAAMFIFTPSVFAQRVRARISPATPLPAAPNVGVHAGHNHGGHGHAGHNHGGHYHHGGYGGNSVNLSFGIGYGYPYRGYYYSSGYPYYPYAGGYGYGYGYNEPYGIYYNPGAQYLDYYLPPVYAPAELAYGPQAMRRFVGPPAVDPFGGIPGGLGAGVVTAKPALERPADGRPVVRISNLESRRRAGHFVETGDELFRAQRYHEALQKYKSAAEAAPDLAESYLRQGHALAATARYEFAAAAFKRGLAIGPEWATAAFRLDSIYGDAHFAKDSHVEHLAKTLVEKPGDSDLIFVLAMFLHYDGDTERAARFFHRAGEIAGKDALHLVPFLTEGVPAKPLPEPAPRDKVPVELPGVEA